MMETPSRASHVAQVSPASPASPSVASIDVLLESLERSAPSSAPTVAMPRTALGAARAPIEEDAQVVSSADIVWSGPLATDSRDGRAAPRSAETPSVAGVDPLLGMIVADRYRIVEAIGRGGMGSVYKVQHTRIGKLLAMKLLSGEMARRPEVARRFKREALAVSKLQSPNTVQVFDFGVSDGLTYLVMELVDGETLGRVLRTGGPMPFLRLGRILVQVCDALAEAHQKGVVHRDIKPENIMLVTGPSGAASGDADVAKVLDFGLAKLREAPGLNDVTCQGTIMGTPNYMAPEQIRGEEVDCRTDVYSVGVLMYRLLTGCFPFSADSQVEVLAKHLYERPIPPAERAPGLAIPLGASRLVMRALRKDPRDRFQRAEDLRALLVEELRAADPARGDRLSGPRALREARAGAALATRDEVDAYERGLRRTRYGVAVAAATVALAAAGGLRLLVPPARDAAGVEIEPNDTAAEATPLRLGEPMTGQIGKRLDATHGDRDFYAFDLPASPPGSGAGPARSFLRLRVSALPGIATCAMLYRPGFADAAGQYCVGRPGKDLVVPTLELEPGRYLLAIVQDLDPYGGAPPHLQESISDRYTLLAESTAPEPATEIEPNDHVASATLLTVGQPCSATLAWARDEDFFCVPAAVSAPLRWVVHAGFRDSGLLEATPMYGEEGGAPVRIHVDARGKRSDTDAQSPWQSAPIASAAGPQRCLRMRLAADPWAPSSGGAGPSGGAEPYVVMAEAVR